MKQKDIFLLFGTLVASATLCIALEVMHKHKLIFASLGIVGGGMIASFPFLREKYQEKKRDIFARQDIKVKFLSILFVLSNTISFSFWVFITLILREKSLSDITSTDFYFGYGFPALAAYVTGAFALFGSALYVFARDEYEVRGVVSIIQKIKIPPLFTNGKRTVKVVSSNNTSPNFKLVEKLEKVVYFLKWWNIVSLPFAVLYYVVGRFLVLWLLGWLIPFILVEFVIQTKNSNLLIFLIGTAVGGLFAFVWKSLVLGSVVGPLFVLFYIKWKDNIVEKALQLRHKISST